MSRTSNFAALRPPAKRAVWKYQRGFTLAGLIVILTIMMVVLAFTVPRMWSDVLRRERDRQAIFAMKQYARAIAEYQRLGRGVPTSLDQLKEARNPRVVRGPKAEWADPLTGEVDWVPISAVARPTGVAAPGTTIETPGTAPITSPSADISPSDTGATTATDERIHRLGTTATSFSGPFIGVRPGVTGRSLLAINGADRYENWSYTTADLQNEVATAMGLMTANGATSTQPVPPTKRP